MASFDPLTSLADSYPFLPQALGLLLTWAIVLLLVRHFSRLIGLLSERSRHLRLDERALLALDRILDTFFYTMGVFVSLLILGVTGALYAGLTAFGVIGLVIGFAGREVLSNILAGFVLILDRPFVIGDAIEVGGYAGVVQRVSLRSCQLRQGDGRYLTLPNAYLTGKPILNNTRSPLRRVEVTLGLLQVNDLGRALGLVRESVEGLEQRLAEKPVDILVTRVADGAVSLAVRFWAAKDDFTAAKSAATLTLTQMCKTEGLELAVPLRKNV